MRFALLMLPLAFLVACGSGTVSTSTDASSLRGTFKTSAAASPSSAAPGATASITATVTSSAAWTVLVDLEVYDASGTKVLQSYFNNQAFSAGQSRTFNASWAIPASQATGAYSIAVGVFSTNWSRRYAWNAAAGTLTVATGAATTPSFSTSASVSPAPVAPGGTGSISASVTSTTAASALVAIDVYDSSGTQVFQQSLDNQSFAAGQTQIFSASWAVPAGQAAGTYSVAVGVFAPGWGPLYSWNASAASLTVTGGTPGGADGGNVCTPQCSGLQCGSDGCGGVCGTCPSGDSCSSGICVAPPSASGFNSLPPLQNVQAAVRGHTAYVTYGSFSGAVDYRIYPMPTSAPAFDSNGVMTVPNAIYRCSGDRADTDTPTPVLMAMWPGLTQQTTLVVEALNGLCPDQGHITPTAISSDPSGLNWLTLDQLRAQSPTGEVFVDGQQLNGSKPAAIARSFVTVSPQSLGTWDWQLDFDPTAPAEVFSELPCNLPSGCFQIFLSQSSQLQVEFNTVDSIYHAIGSVLGELRTTFVDWANDTNGKFRVTPFTWANMSSAGYLHVTMDTEVITTDRRYPQIFITDQPFPISDNLVNGNTVLVQSKGNGGFGDPFDLEVQVCDHRTWDVNNQCPGFRLDSYWETGFNGVLPLGLPVPPLADSMAWDHRAQFDVYASTQRVYVFFENQPYGCVVLPTSGVPNGPVTVTFANTLYHSGASDSIPLSPYGENQMRVQTQARFGNLAFSSGVAQPAWDESVLPCFPASSINDNM